MSEYENNTSTEIERKRVELDNYLKARLWIGDNGEIVCTLHGGQYLQDRVLTYPQKLHHQTPLNLWLDITNRPDYIFPCEVCMSEAEVRD